MTGRFCRWVCVAAVLACVAAPVPGQGVMLAPGDEVPEMRGFDSEMNLHVVDYAAADYTLLNFWATWCQPCRREMPMLQAAHEKYGPDSLQVIGVTSERLDNEALAEFVAEMGLSYPVFRIGDEYRRDWPGVRGTLPNSVLVDREGKLVRRYIGASDAQIEGMKNDLATVLADRPLGKMVMPSNEGIVKGQPERTNR